MLRFKNEKWWCATTQRPKPPSVLLYEETPLCTTCGRTHRDCMRGRRRTRLRFSRSTSISRCTTANCHRCTGSRVWSRSRNEPVWIAWLGHQIKRLVDRHHQLLLRRKWPFTQRAWPRRCSRTTWRRDEYSTPSDGRTSNRCCLRQQNCSVGWPCRNIRCAHCTPSISQRVRHLCIC